MLYLDCKIVHNSQIRNPNGTRIPYVSKLSEVSLKNEVKEVMNKTNGFCRKKPKKYLYFILIFMSYVYSISPQYESNIMLNIYIAPSLPPNPYHNLQLVYHLLSVYHIGIICVERYSISLK